MRTWITVSVVALLLSLPTVGAAQEGFGIPHDDPLLDIQNNDATHTISMWYSLALSERTVVLFTDMTARLSESILDMLADEKSPTAFSERVRHLSYIMYARDFTEEASKAITIAIDQVQMAARFHRTSADEVLENMIALQGQVDNTLAQIDAAYARHSSE